MGTDEWHNAEEARALLARQREAWPTLRAGCEALERAAVKGFGIGDLRFKAQYNPARVGSSAARTDSVSVGQRPCFLCPARLAPQQEALPMGTDYLLLCNPYPIFPEHFTIASRRHLPQRILDSFADFLQMAQRLSGLTLFYNGPQCGASAPDHLHFQAVTRGYMPVDSETEGRQGAPLLKETYGIVCRLSDYLRNGFVIEAQTAEGAEALFVRVLNVLPLAANEPEPRMNVFCRYEEGRWLTTLIPRLAHRPRQYYAEGEERLLVSPGAADMGGVFVTVLEKDFDRMTPDLARDIYRQTAFDDDALAPLAASLQRPPAQP
jgi:hypothetical protein